MEITSTLIANVALLILPPIIIVLLFRLLLARHIRWATVVVAVVDLAVFQETLFYYESVWIAGFFLIVQLAAVGSVSHYLFKKHSAQNKQER